MESFEVVETYRLRVELIRYRLLLVTEVVKGSGHFCDVLFSPFGTCSLCSSKLDTLCFSGIVSCASCVTLEQPLELFSAF